MTVPNLKGPQLPNQSGILDIELPNCVQIKTPEDSKQFQDFIAKIIQAARTAWESEKT